MTPEELAGQLFMISYKGTYPESELLEWIEKKNAGGIKIFGKNAASLISLAESIKAMQEAAEKSKWQIPLFIATDQEGGWVRHIKEETSVTPGNIALGAEGLPGDTWKTGFYINRELKVLGINMNFAPTVDIYLNHKNSVIGPRAFSSDPLKTSVLSCAYYQGMKEAGIIAAAKHFPGHGRTEKDSHGTLPVIDIDLDELMKTDLLPYSFLIKEKIPVIMSGHLAYPKITGDIRPATLSPVLLKDLLRKKLKFDGIIITDDMVMNGAVQYSRNIALSCFEAVKAGIDMILISRSYEDFEAARKMITDEIKIDPEFKKQIIESAKRILKVKMEYIKPAGKAALFPDTEKIKSFFPDKEAEEFFFQQSCRSVSVIKSADFKAKGKILLAGEFRDFFDEGLRRFPDAETLLLKTETFYDAGNSQTGYIDKICGKYDKIIFCISNPATAEILKRMEKYKEKIIVLSALTPVYLEEIPWVERGVAVYGTGYQSFRAGFAAIAGDFMPKGKIPIDLGYKK